MSACLSRSRMCEIQSPCVKICVLDPVSRMCTGCGRTLDETGNWLHLTDEGRLKVAAELPDRLALLKEREPV
jgi:uncharacterized protein